MEIKNFGAKDFIQPLTGGKASSGEQQGVIKSFKDTLIDVAQASRAHEAKATEQTMGDMDVTAMTLEVSQLSSAVDTVVAVKEKTIAAWQELKNMQI